MLRGKHQRYDKLYLYSLDRQHPALHHIEDEDFIGCWEEDDLAILFFHRDKKALVEKLATDLGLKLEDSAQVSYDEWGEGRKVGPLKIGDVTLRPVWQDGPGLVFDPGWSSAPATTPPPNFPSNGSIPSGNGLAPLKRPQILAAGPVS